MQPRACHACISFHRVKHFKSVDVVMTLHIYDFREIAMMSKGDSTESSNPFAEIEEEDEDADGEVNGDEAESLDVAIPEWLAELPDDLEVRN
jgi:hypothetical protein